LFTDDQSMIGGATSHAASNQEEAMDAESTGEDDIFSDSDTDSDSEWDPYQRIQTNGIY
jgi:hypothetical protein